MSSLLHPPGSLAAVFGGGSGTSAEGQSEERTGLITPMSEN